MVTWTITEWKLVQWCKSLLRATQRTAPRSLHCISLISTFITVIFIPLCKHQYLLKMQSTGLSAHSHCQGPCAPAGDEPWGWFLQHCPCFCPSVCLSPLPGDGTVTAVFYSGNNPGICNGKNKLPWLTFFWQQQQQHIWDQTSFRKPMPPMLVFVVFDNRLKGFFPVFTSSTDSRLCLTVGTSTGNNYKSLWNLYW